ncbi:TPA: helix-turn-helix transcriptional regulator [Streptococcus equi subsp. zooepidemicus]|nr:helix-turn-helix transcriptional regulator [Streptococcus equi subsp. zooepidemicus]HEL1163229.1 helix-turn-helix transcriptional regulator [Streptococcus equi subsp. zooepidemicus]HEL1194739.1 helix-turn-helix transcriptional regulator [Streptococcus equi subsp. zooepidemicus]
MYRRLKDLREDRDFSQKEIADFLSYTHSAYSKIERGERVLSAEVLIELSSLYNVSTDYILGLTNYPYRNNQKNK